MSPLPPNPTRGKREGHSPIRYLDTVAAYDLWSEVYDTDGNFLQALDTIEMQYLIPQMLSQISAPTPWKLVDLGCGTGRNTTPLLKVPVATVVGLDSSPKMLDLARLRISTHIATSRASPELAKEVYLELYNMLSSAPVPAVALNADALISTLVLEHIPISQFFTTVSHLLRPGGIALITNMHSEMGEISQAGFRDASSGMKIRTQSFAHRLEDVIAEAQKQGFNVVGDIVERRVDEKMSKVLGARAKKWVGVTVWFGICLRKQE